MTRTILTPQQTHIELDIPAEYVGKTIEITLSALEETTVQQSKMSMADFWGTLSDETSQSLRRDIERSRSEWDRNI